MRERSIPGEHETKVLKWFLGGQTYREIAERLDAECRVDTSAGSVHRLVDRLARGECDEAVSRSITKVLRRTIPQAPPEPTRASSNGQVSPKNDALSKQGRNERCACGSGLKFKRCCGS